MFCFLGKEPCTHKTGQDITYNIVYRFCFHGNPLMGFSMLNILRVKGVQEPYSPYFISVCNLQGGMELLPDA